MYMTGALRFPKTADEVRKLIGKKIRYLRTEDVDNSGRGYLFPKSGTVEDVNGKNVSIDGSWVYYPSILEYIVLKDGSSE
jgi:hypothetical protein